MSVKIIAEISSNHMGDTELAKDMIAAASECGCSHVKFQTWHEKNLRSGPWNNDGRRDFYKKAELLPSQYFTLSNYCKTKNIKFLTSVFNIDDLDFIKNFTNEIKIPSTELINTKLVEKAIDLYDIIYMSTGTCTWKEYYGYTINPKIILMHCVSVYPCPAENANLQRMKRMGKRFGYSGHCEGIWDAIAAIAMGATVIEKHFTTSKEIPFRDAKFALLPEEMRQIIQFAKQFELMNIFHGINRQDCEREVREQYSGRWTK